jgi:hypothetical protein
VAAVRRLFVDRLTRAQLAAVAEVAEGVLAALDPPPEVHERATMPRRIP